MTARFGPGDAVQTPFGKGVVREVRNGGRLSVDLPKRTIVLAARDVSPLASRRSTRASADPDSPRNAVAAGPPLSAAIDLHGLTVAEALVQIDQALNDALLAGRTELRVIHGRSGGRIRGALHDRLRAVGAVRAFRLDPRNAGVTIVSL